MASRNKFPALGGCCGTVYRLVLIYGNPLMLVMLPASSPLLQLSTGSGWIQRTMAKVAPSLVEFVGSTVTSYLNEVSPRETDVNESNN